MTTRDDMLARKAQYKEFQNSILNGTVPAKLVGTGMFIFTLQLLRQQGHECSAYPKHSWYKGKTYLWKENSKHFLPLVKGYVKDIWDKNLSSFSKEDAAWKIYELYHDSNNNEQEEI